MSTSRKFKRDQAKVDYGKNKVRGYWKYLRLLAFINADCADEIIREWSEKEEIKLYDMPIGTAYYSLKAYVHKTPGMWDKIEKSRNKKMKRIYGIIESGDDSI